MAEKLNAWGWRDYLKNGLGLAGILCVRALQALCFWVPLKGNRITVYSLKQRGFCCNLKYLTLALPEGWEYLWIVGRESDARCLEHRGIPVAMLHSAKHFWWRMGSKIIITNDDFPPLFYRRRGQVYLNTWHGGINYKRIGALGLEFQNPLQRLLFRMRNPQPDHFLSGSRSFTDTTARAFGFSREIFREWGLPRNDLLCTGESPDARQALGIPASKKIALYAPTFRRGGVGPTEKMDTERLKDSLKIRFGGEWIVLRRSHYFVASGQENGALDVSEYEDMQELLAAADVLICDYSSAMWDYLLTGRPCFVFAPDLEEYRTADRDFFIQPQGWPYPIAAHMAGLCREIESFDEAGFREKARRHRREQGSFDTGQAREKLLELLNEIRRSP